MFDNFHAPPTRWTKVRVARAVNSQIVLFTREDHFNAIIQQIEVKIVSRPTGSQLLILLMLCRIHRVILATGNLSDDVKKNIFTDFSCGNFPASMKEFNDTLESDAYAKYVGQLKLQKKLI